MPCFTKPSTVIAILAASSGLASAQLTFTIVPPPAVPVPSNNSDGIISGNGLAVVGNTISNDPFRFIGFRWNAVDGSSILPTLCSPASRWDAIEAVNTDGSVAIGFTFDSTGCASPVRWDTGTATALPVNFAADVAGDGSSVVGGAPGSDGFSQAVRIPAGGAPIALGEPAEYPDASIALSISGDGAVTVGSVSEHRFLGQGSGYGYGYGGPVDVFRFFNNATIWDAAGNPTLLPHLPGDNSSEAIRVSADGSVIIGRSCLVSTDPDSDFSTCRTVRYVNGVPSDFSSILPNDFEIRGISGNGNTIITASQIWDADAGLWNFTDLLVALGVDLTTLSDPPFPPTISSIADDGRTITFVGTRFISGPNVFVGTIFITTLPTELPIAPGGCPCPIDYDNSGSTIPDLDDLIAFFNDFNNGLPAADVDCTGEGSIPDIDDILLFFSVFTNGC